MEQNLFQLERRVKKLEKNLEKVNEKVSMSKQKADVPFNEEMVVYNTRVHIGKTSSVRVLCPFANDQCPFNGLDTSAYNPPRCSKLEELGGRCLFEKCCHHTFTISNKHNPLKDKLSTTEITCLTKDQLKDPNLFGNDANIRKKARDHFEEVHGVTTDHLYDHFEYKCFGNKYKKRKPN